MINEKFPRITIIPFRKMNNYVNYENFCSVYLSKDK